VSALHHEVLAAMRADPAPASADWIVANMRLWRERRGSNPYVSWRRVACCLASLRRQGLAVRGEPLPILAGEPRRGHLWSVP
jgi:hypothetical protein